MTETEVESKDEVSSSILDIGSDNQKAPSGAF